MIRMQLHWQVLIALALAVLAGLATSPDSRLLGVPLLEAYGFIGSLFLNALKMLIVPLIVASIIAGMAGNQGGEGLGRLGGKTLAWYLATTALAALVGLLALNLVQPGIVDGQPARDSLGLAAETGAVLERVADRDSGDLMEIFLRMLPPNIVAAAAEGQMLGLIVFSLLFGYFVTRLPTDLASGQRNFWEGMAQVMLKITELVMRFAPLGVFGLVAKVVATSGLEAFLPLATFFFTVLAALAVHMFLVLPALLLLVGRVNPVAQFRALSPALLTAFSTASSSATLPLTMDCVEKRAGVSERVTSFVLPLGATVNMDGTALYEAAAVLFIAQAYGVELGLVQQFTVVLLALLTSIGVAGIPAASLVAITLILTYFGLPAEAIGLILATDRLLDMCRTSVNVFSDACGAVVIARSEGESPLSEEDDGVRRGASA
jgi:Na+/H+-dicarboxylate symporter